MTASAAPTPSVDRNLPHRRGGGRGDGHQPTAYGSSNGIANSKLVINDDVGQSVAAPKRFGAQFGGASSRRRRSGRVY